MLALLVAVAIGAGVWKMRSGTKTGPRYVTARVSVGEIVESIEATGTVQPLLSVQVGPQVSGRVLRVLTDFNRTVHEGDLLAELRTPIRFKRG